MRPGSEAERPPSPSSAVKNERSSAFPLSRVFIKSTGKILPLLLDMGWWGNGRLFSLVLISALLFHMQLSLKLIIFVSIHATKKSYKLQIYKVIQNILKARYFSKQQSKIL